MITVHTRHTSVCMAPRLWLSRQENCPWSSGKAKDLKLQCLGFELQNWHKMFVPWREHLHITPELLHEYWFVLFVNKSNQHSIGQIGNIQLINDGEGRPQICLDRTIGASQISWKTFPHENSLPTWTNKAHIEGLKNDKSASPTTLPPHMSLTTYEFCQLGGLFYHSGNNWLFPISCDTFETQSVL